MDIIAALYSLYSSLQENGTPEWLYDTYEDMLIMENAFIVCYGYNSLYRFFSLVILFKVGFKINFLYITHSLVRLPRFNGL